MKRKDRPAASTATRAPDTNRSSPLPPRGEKIKLRGKGKAKAKERVSPSRAIRGPEPRGNRGRISRRMLVGLCRLRMRWMFLILEMVVGKHFTCAVFEREGGEEVRVSFLFYFWNE